MSKMKTRGKVLKTTYPVSTEVKQAIKSNDEFEAEFFSGVSSSSSEDTNSDYDNNARKRKRRNKATTKKTIAKKSKKLKSLRETVQEPTIARSLSPATAENIVPVICSEDSIGKSTESTRSASSHLDSLQSTPVREHLVSVDVPPSPVSFDKSCKTPSFDTNLPEVIHLSIANVISQARQIGLDPTAEFTGRVLKNGTIKIEDAVNKDGRPAAVPIPKLDELPREIALKIYRKLFFTPHFIDFNSRNDLNRSAAILRTCKKIHKLGTEVLYGENAFHFERRCSTRGAYFEKVWKEIGYKDVWRFFDTIGPRNTGHIRYISLEFSDAVPSQTPYLEEIDRKVTNDGNLLDVFKMIAAGGVLETLALSFLSRRNIDRNDYWFLKNLTAIRCYELVIYSQHNLHTNKLASGVEEKLRKLMVTKRDTAAGKFEKKVPPKMMQDHPNSQKHIARW